MSRKASFLCLHYGKPDSVGVLTFRHSHYWFKNCDEDWVKVPLSGPQSTHHQVRRMFGVTLWWGQWFIGVIQLDPPCWKDVPEYLR